MYSLTQKQQTLSMFVSSEEKVTYEEDIPKFVIFQCLFQEFNEVEGIYASMKSFQLSMFVSPSSLASPQAI